jgi:hypothetical protein
MADQEELLDYEEDENQEQAAGAAGKTDASKKGYVGIHSTSFKDMLLKEPLFDAIQRCGFEHPSEGKFPLHHNEHWAADGLHGALSASQYHGAMLTQLFAQYSVPQCNMRPSHRP